MNTHPTFLQALPVWARIGVLSFGGPAGQIALMHRVLVEERRWISEERFLHALSFCMLLPGPEAMQLATYVGWLLHGIRGGLAAGLLFVAPGALVVLALSITYAALGALPVTQALFLGIKAAVLVIVVEALLRLGGRALRTPRDYALAAAAFAALFLFDAPFPLVVLAALLIGFLLSQASVIVIDAPEPHTPPTRTLATVALWLAIWWLPLLAIAAVFGWEHTLWRLGVFFSQLAVVTFGGAYSVLTYMAQQAVETHGWLEPGEMLDGLGLAETTPGPLILVTEFVGFLAAFRHGGGPRMAMGLLGGAVALWATFAPCFLWIFAGAPYVERIRGSARLAGALRAVTAAVVGVILNLSLWFALHVLFGEVNRTGAGPIHVWWPTPGSIDPVAAALTLLAGAALFALRLGIVPTLGLSALAALLWHWALA